MDDRKHCEDAGIQEEIVFPINSNMALNMMKAAYETGVPFSWVTADSIYGDFRDYKVLIYDNSDRPTLIFRKENGFAESYPNNLWSDIAFLRAIVR